MATSDIQSIIDKLNMALATNRSKLADAKRNEDKVKAKIRESEKSLSKAQSAVSQEKARLDAMVAKEMFKVESAVTEARRELDTNNAELNRIKNEISGYEREVIKAEDEIKKKNILFNRNSR